VRTNTESEKDGNVLKLTALFLEDGSKIHDPATKSFKLDVNKFITKYQLKVSKFLNKRPKALIDA
jgi:hypothetical protein